MDELTRLAGRAVSEHRLRSGLSVLGVAIGIASVILLTSVGEGTRRHILQEFSQFGTNLLAVNPGKAKTLGIPGVLGGTTHKLTIDDALALLRIPGVENVVPVSMGQARVEAAERGRSVYVYGVTPDVSAVWGFQIRQGSFWPRGDPRSRGALAVLGPTLARELFRTENPLGRFVRIGGTRFRVAGVMAPKGRMLGFDIDDAVYVPVANAMALFDQDELYEIDILYAHPGVAATVEDAVRTALTARHQDTEDFTLTSQAAMLEAFGNVMDVITTAVGAIAGISLLVGATGILTMMWIAVGERTAEVGLVRALGATRRQVLLLFLAEAAALSTLGGALGVAFGLAVCALLRAVVPGLPVHTPLAFVLAALAVSVLTGLVSGVLPARRGARLDPIEALRAE